MAVCRLSRGRCDRPRRENDEVRQKNRRLEAERSGLGEAVTGENGRDRRDVHERVDERHPLRQRLLADVAMRIEPELGERPRERREQHRPIRVLHGDGEVRCIHERRQREQYEHRRAHTVQQPLGALALHFDRRTSHFHGKHHRPASTSSEG